LLPVQAFRLDPKAFFVTDKTLDFTLVGVTEMSAKGQPISRYPPASARRIEADRIAQQ
jgi:hypothetical protein